MKKSIFCLCLLFTAFTRLFGQYDYLIRNGMIYDGSGKTPFAADLAINGDTIAAIGNLSKSTGRKEIDVHGMAVTPGFVNMLSWGTVSLITEGLAQSDIRQGVTLNVMGEGESMGPVSEKMRQEFYQGKDRFELNWTTLAGYLKYLEKRGVSTNVASFVGATTLRVYTIGYDDRKATDEEIRKMQELVRAEMREGAMGIGSSLIYPPAFYSSTEELIAICKAAAEYGGMYISHMRSEGNKIEAAMDELIRISKEAGVPAEIYHLKAAGKQNWYKEERILAKIDSARAAGLAITADMYTYTAGATGLNACLPPWVQDGGFEKSLERMKDSATRVRLKKEMNVNADDWENLYYAAGPEGIMVSDVLNEKLRPYVGKRISEIAQSLHKSPEETIMDLIIEDHSRVEMIVFMMKEENLAKQISKPYVGFGSDASSLSPEGVFLKASVHPRTYGNVARLFAKYVRDQKIITVQEAVRRLSGQPCANLKIKKRGLLQTGYYADVNVFDPSKIQDHATFEKPHQYSTGMTDVFVNGVPVLMNGEHTGAMPGRFVKGPGYGKK